MTVRPPRSTGLPKAPDNPLAALEYEFAQEKASALGRLGRQLEAALAALAAFDLDHADKSGHGDEERRARRALVDAAGQALWHLVVQRECLGLRDSPRLMQDYRVPDEVRNRMGMAPANIATPKSRPAGA